MAESRLKIGVDEAGRGSIVGELFIAAVAIRRGDEELLQELGVRDSKKLSPEARRELYHAVLKKQVFAVIAIPPRELDAYNINMLEEIKIVDLLESLRRRLGDLVLEARITIDKFGDPARLEKRLRSRGFRGEIVVEEKADERYVEVAAASVIAKHLRDTRLKVLSRLYGVEGSGYPSDERTVRWVEKILGEGSRPSILRYSWGTLEKLGYPRPGRKSSVYHKTLDEYL